MMPVELAWPDLAIEPVYPQTFKVEGIISALLKPGLLVIIRGLYVIPIEGEAANSWRVDATTGKVNPMGLLT